MRQMCPYCGKLVDLPDDAAGTEVPCPACAKPFAVPKAYAPSVSDKPAPPPGFVPPAVLAATPAPEIAAANDDESSITFDGRLAGWLAPICLTLTLVSALFFSWVVSYPGGYRVFAQSPIQALFADFNGNTIKSLQNTQKTVEGIISWNGLMLPFFLALILATLFAWFDRFYSNPTLATVPAPLAWMVRFHEWRHTFLIVLTGLCTVLIIGQILRGFGMETALKSAATHEFVQKLAAADNAADRLELEIQIGQEIGKWCLGGTLARNLGVIFLVVALESLLVRWWLEHRGPLPPPKLSLQY